jgi:hypothetical protein
VPLGFFPSPLYVPVRSACQPRGTENDAFPLLKGKLLINALVPSKTEAVPVAVAGVTVTVMTADRPTTPMDWGRAKPDGGSGLTTCCFKRAHVATTLKPSRRSG